jgi:predicted metal-binding membrane protein
MTTRPAPARGVPALRSWTRAELVLACTLLALAAVAWLVTDALAMPEMRTGILTNIEPMQSGAGAGPMALALFAVIWVVMMAAMMLPAITPFTVGLHRLMQARGARGRVAALTVGYLSVWSTAGLIAILIVRGFETLATRSGGLAAGAGAVVLLVAGAYQFTPLKHWCLVRCRSPLALVMLHGERAARCRRGALLAGLSHGGYCLGCCWALMLILLAAGMMSLVWMAGLAGVIAIEKTLPRGDTFSYVLGGLLVGAGVLLLAHA